MPSFDFQSLLWWGLPLVAAPIIIHLINILRHRRVEWAAMEFLLASQRKYRTRVLLKQLLLLLARVAAVLGIVLALAGPRWRSAIGGLLGGGRTVHVVILDDSYSMGDVSAGLDEAGEPLTAFARGKRVAERIVADLAVATGVQEVVIGRSSRLTLPSAAGVAPGFDLPRQAVTPQALQAIRSALADMPLSMTACGPAQPLAATAELLGAGSGAGRVLWLVSDFRSRDWKAADDLAAALRGLAAAGVQLHLVDCASTAAPNLAIERLDLAGGVAATGVVVPLEVTVHNHGDRPVRDVQVELREDGASRPGVRIGGIAAGAAVTQRFDATFTAAGSHTLEARIGPDAVAADNARDAVLDVVDRIDVLLVDGGLAAAGGGAGRAGDAFYVAAALAPGVGAPTGLNPRIEPPRALATLDLDQFAGIWLLDVERLEAAEVAALEAYAKAGGGVVFFSGPRTKPAAVNDMFYRDGSGLFPVPLAGAVDLLAQEAAGDAAVPDVVVEDHPVVAVLAGQRNPLLDAVRIERFMAVDRGFSPPSGSGLRRLLSLRTGGPLCVERPFGAGLVVAVLTTAAPTWNNWARGNPSWVVVMLELQSHLARSRRQAESLEVGEPLRVPLEAGVDALEVDVGVPPEGTIVHVTGKAGDAGALTATLPATATAGIYTARWPRLDGTERERSFAVNVDPAEGQLERFGRDRLERLLSGVPFAYETADAIQPQADALAGVSLLQPLLIGLAIVLVLEQLLAYSASYHPSTRSPV
jgi:hypothetical protein